MVNFLRRWFQFFRERFPLRYAVPVIVLFVLGNSAIASDSLRMEARWDRILIAMIMCISFFYRLVIFTEVHDYQYDCRWNPIKPLARGLISVNEAVIVGFATIIFEMILTAFVGYYSFTVHLLPISWSLLIWRDFFVPQFFHRHPILNVYIRGVVLLLCGYSVGVTSQERSLLNFPNSFYLFGIVNWAVFCFYYVLIHSHKRFEDLNYRYILGRRLNLVFILIFPLIIALVIQRLWFWMVFAVLVVSFVYRRLTHRTNHFIVVSFIYILYLSIYLNSLFFI